MQDLNSVRLSSKGYYPAKKNFFMKTCNCLFIARSCNGLCRSAMSELLNSLRAFLISTVRSITPPTRSSSLLFSLSPSAAAVPPHCHPSWQVGIRLATDPFSGSCLKVSSTIINNRVYIVVQVVCNLILQAVFTFSRRTMKLIFRLRSTSSLQMTTCRP